MTMVYVMGVIGTVMLVVGVFGLRWCYNQRIQMDIDSAAKQIPVVTVSSVKPDWIQTTVDNTCSLIQKHWGKGVSDTGEFVYLIAYDIEVYIGGAQSVSLYIDQTELDLQSSHRKQLYDTVITLRDNKKIDRQNEKMLKMAQKILSQEK